MPETIAAFFRSFGRALRRLGAILFAGLVWPVLAAHGWYRDRSLYVKLPVAAFLLLFVGLYGYFFVQTQIWRDFDIDLPARYNLAERKLPAGGELPVTAGQPKTCQPSAMVSVMADLTDTNVNKNAWISSMLLYRLGFFGIDWDHTPFLDNKASFQRGVNQAVRRSAVEMVDLLGRVRGTSGINNNLQDARNNLQFDEFSWYFGLSPFGPKTPTPSYYRSAIASLNAFNADLSACNAVFDGRADNLMQFIDRIANDLGSTSALVRERSENYDGGWFDTRADDRFWFAYGQLYGYYAILAAAEADFRPVIAERSLGSLYRETLKQFRAALNIQPAIISNGSEDGWIMPTHLATMGFYILRARSNLVELRSVLDR